MESIARFRNWSDIDKNLNVFLLFAVGTFFLWVPYLRYGGYFMDFVAVILLFTRRNYFAETQRKYVLVSCIAYALTLILLLALALFPSIVMPAFLSQSVPLAEKEIAFDHVVLAYFAILVVFGIVLSVSFLSAVWNLVRNRDRIVSIAAMAFLIGIPLLNVVDLSRTMLLGYNIAIDFGNYGSLIKSVLSYSGRYALYSVIPFFMFVYVFARTAKNISNFTSDEEERLMEKYLIHQ